MQLNNNKYNKLKDRLIIIISHRIRSQKSRIHSRLRLTTRLILISNQIKPQTPNSPHLCSDMTHNKPNNKISRTTTTQSHYQSLSKPKTHSPKSKTKSIMINLPSFKLIIIYVKSRVMRILRLIQLKWSRVEKGLQTLNRM